MIVFVSVNKAGERKEVRGARMRDDSRAIHGGTDENKDVWNM